MFYHKTAVHRVKRPRKYRAVTYVTTLWVCRFELEIELSRSCVENMRRCTALMCLSNETWCSTNLELFIFGCFTKWHLSNAYSYRFQLCPRCTTSSLICVALIYLPFKLQDVDIFICHLAFQIKNILLCGQSILQRWIGRCSWFNSQQTLFTFALKCKPNSKVTKYFCNVHYRGNFRKFGVKEKKELKMWKWTPDLEWRRVESQNNYHNTA